MLEIQTEKEFMKNELAEEVRMFFPETEQAKVSVQHTAFCENGHTMHRVLVQAEGKHAQCTLQGAAEDQPPMIQKRLDKRAAKLAAYRCLETLCGHGQPWGSLTGVRPVSMLRQLKREHNEAQFTDVLGVKPEKAALSEEIIRVQDDMMAKADKNSVCVYAGIPFCVTRCSYCSFPAVVAKKGQREAYVSALVKEISATGRLLKDEQKQVCAVYLGGGTPTALTDEQLFTVMQAIKDAFGTGYEYTLEAGRPDTITEEKLSLSQKFGINRLCINPQTMQDRTLQRIGRRHTAAEIVDCYTLARKFGFSHINADLIAGLPGETLADFADTLLQIKALAPSSLTCHTLSIKRGSKLIEEQYLHENAADVAAMVDLARQTAYEMGMQPYYLYRQKHMAGNLENVGYAKPGDACLYNVAMMDEMMDVLALGVGAVSKRIVGSQILRRPNPRDIALYIRRIEEICEQKSAFFHG